MSADAPYESTRRSPREIDLRNWEMTIDQCVAVLLKALRERGVLTGGPTVDGVALPPCRPRATARGSSQLARGAGGRARRQADRARRPRRPRRAPLRATSA